MNSLRRDLPWLMGVGLIALAFRLSYLAQVRGAPLFLGLGLDAKFYHRWAQAIAGGDFWGEGPFFMGPLYPYFLAFIYSLGGAADPLHARMVQAVVGAASAVIIALLGREVGGRWAGAAAGLMAALYPPFILFDGEILFPVLQVPLVAAGLLLLLRAGRVGSGRSWFAAGVLLGVAAIGNASLLVFAPAAALWAWRVSRPVGGGKGRARETSFRRSFAPALLVILGVAIAVLPVTARNYVVGRDLVLITSNAGLNFYIGNSAESSGAYIKPAGLDVERDPEGRAMAEQALGRKLKPSEISAFWAGRAWEFVRREPGGTSRLWVKKFTLFWGNYEAPQIENFLFQRESSAILRLPFLSFGVLLGLAALGLLFLSSRWHRAGPLILLPLIHSLVISSFFVVARYRISVVPALMALAAAGLAALPGEVRRRDTSRLLGGGVLAVGLLLASLANPFGVRRDSGFGQCHYRQGVELEKVGRLGEAEREYEKSISFAPDYAPAHLNLGGIYGRRGDSEAARREFAQALRLDPEYPKAHYNMAALLEETGELREAALSYERASRLDPAWFPPREALVRLSYLEGRLGEVEERLAALPGQGSAGFRQRVARYRELLGRRREAAGEIPLSEKALSWWRVLLRADVDLIDGAAASAAERYGSLAESDAPPALRAAALYELGALAYGEQDQEKARAAFTRALAVRPGLPQAHFALGNLAVVEGDYRRAVEEFRAELQGNPRHAPSWLNLGVCYENVLHDYPGALQAYSRYLELEGAAGEHLKLRVEALEAHIRETGHDP